MKLDGYRALAIKSNGKVLLRSNKDFNAKYPDIVTALGALPDETVIDGEVVALDHTGRPSFNALQNVGASRAAVVNFVFDVVIFAGQNAPAAIHGPALAGYTSPSVLLTLMSRTHSLM